MRWLIDGEHCRQIPADDRGLAFGDGVFETLRVRNAQLEAWPLHWQRLNRSLKALGLPVISEECIQRDIDLLGLPQDGLVKLLLTAGSSQAGYSRPGKITSRRLLAVSDHAPTWPEQGVRLFDCRTRLAKQPATAGIKHLCRLEQVLARAEWHDESYHDGLMRDQKGRIIETTCANLLVYLAGEWLTPSLHACGVAGIMRQRIINHLAQAGQAVSDCELNEADLRAAEEVLVVNSIRGIAPLRHWKNQTWEHGPRCRDLQRALAADIEFGVR